MSRSILLLPPSVLLLAVACSSTTAPPGSTAGTEDAGGTPTAPAKEAGSTEPEEEDGGNEPDAGPTQQEKEPNDGTTETEVGTMTIPGSMGGALDPKGDVDLFSIAPQPGELWEWTLAPVGGALAPSLTVFDLAGNSPTMLGTSDTGTPLKLQHFVLASGNWLAAVRDSRNPTGAKNVGGPSFTYTLTATKKTPSPTAVTIPSTKTGKLASLSSVDLYSFTLPTSTGLDVIIRAERKAQPSTLDSRVSIFETGTKKSLGTNDDASGQTPDSQLGGTLPAGSYVVVVDNEGTNGADLSYEIEFKLR